MSLIPTGTIIMWHGTAATIPDGWQKCDGTNGTPDLQGKFVYGASASSDVDATGGATSHSHTLADVATNAVSHTHHASGNVSAASGGFNGTVGNAVTVASASHTHSYGFTSGANTGSHDHSTPDTGNASILPPYSQLYYIMKL